MGNVAPTVYGAATLANPIKEYDTYFEAKKVLGFAPLYLPTIAGYNLYYVSVINGELADLSYRRLGAPDTEIRVRTALETADGKKDISGIYSSSWTETTVKDLPVTMCKLRNKTFAAHWKTGGYLFSVQTEGLSQTEFADLLEDGLVDLSLHYYPVDKNSSTIEPNR